MNIFWDHEGPLIAFNRGGSIFCNAYVSGFMGRCILTSLFRRYFVAWRALALLEEGPNSWPHPDDELCQSGRANDAFISWYFSIAHGKACLCLKRRNI